MLRSEDRPMPRSDAQPDAQFDRQPGAGRRRSVDLSVYLVTDTEQCGGVDGVVRTVREAVPAGVTLVQLRDHHLSDDDFVALGRRLVDVLDGTGVPLLIDDRVHLVGPIGAQGAHVGQDDMPIDRARAMLGPDAVLGLSTQTPGHVAAARAMGEQLVDYLGVGALHSTGTKPEAGDLGMATVASVVEVSPWPVCAIGGVKADDAAPLAAIGCDGMSVVSAICGQPDIAAATRRLVDAWSRATGVPAAHTGHTAGNPVGQASPARQDPSASPNPSPDKAAR